METFRLDKPPKKCYHIDSESGMIPITKNNIRALCKSKTKGAAPIEKNVIVIDEQGKEYEATYPKRAKGLVKNGRARFVDENTICLACPPDSNLEAKKMENTTLTIKDIFNAITEIKNDSAHIEKALTQLESVQSKGPGDIAAQANAQAIADVVKCRETTLQQALGMYYKMYDDMQNEMEKKVNLISKAFDSNMSFINDSDACEDDKLEALGYITVHIRDLIGKVLFEEKTEN